MKQLINKGVFFIRKNPTIIYSLVLIFVVVGALFLNSYFIVTSFQASLDKTLRAKAVLAEDVLGVVGRDYFSNLSQNKTLLQEKIAEIQKRDPEIVEMVLYSNEMTNNEYLAIVSSKSTLSYEQDQLPDPSKINQNSIKFALSVDDAFAYISNNKGERFWNVVKSVKDNDGIVRGVLLLKLSLAENDALVGRTIFQVYIFSIAAMVVVLLLVFNHIRLFAFEIKAKKLEEIDKMKDDFISMASHELKSPLTAIGGYTELLTDTLKTEKISLENKKDQNRYLTNINISVERLKTLVEDLLDVSRIQQNRMPITLEEVDLVKIVSEISDEMSILVKEKKLELKHDIAEVSKISADPARLKQIIINLISNAIKYTPSGSVEIQIKEDAENVYLTVADTGLGISAKNMEKLFSKFYRVETEYTAGIAGTGLGLWIAREIARKMGGELGVESIEGVGSHFTLTMKKIRLDGGQAK